MLDTVRVFTEFTQGYCEAPLVMTARSQGHAYNNKCSENGIVILCWDKHFTTDIFIGESE